MRIFDNILLSDNSKSTKVIVYLEESSKLKRISLRFRPEKKDALIKAPRGTSVRYLRGFLQKHIEWIRLQAEKLQHEPATFTDGCTLMFANQAYTVKHTLSSLRHIEKDQDELCVSCPQKQLDSMVRSWLYEQAKLQFHAYSAHYANIIGVTYNTIRVKNVKTKWGSCSALKNLNYNWRLIFAPEWVLAYVCAHEVSHLVHMNHSAAFWKLLGSVHPEAKSAVDWLKKNGKSLYAFG